MPSTPKSLPPPARADEKPEEDEQQALEPAWYLSSWELKEGLTVIEDDDTTLPGDLFDL